MTEPIDFLINTAGGQRSITIDPINVTATSGILYATGQYDLKEGSVGIGTITFTSDKDWTFDGVGDINNADIKHIADFIRKTDRTPAALKDNAGDKTATANTEDSQSQSKTLTIIVNDKGTPVDVRIEMNYPFYDVAISGKATAQLEQDHHSNWFVTKGQLADHLVQEIGRRISQYVLG